MDTINIQQKLLNGVDHIATRILLLDPNMLVYLEKLSGKVIQFVLLNTDIDIFILPLADRITFASQYQGEVDVVIKASPSALLGLLRSKDSKVGDMEIIGDVAVAQNLLSIFKEMDIDWEEHLSQFIGDIGAYQISYCLQNICRFAGSVRETIRLNAKEYIYYEKNVLPNPEELESFYHSVDELHNDVERLQKRIQRLESSKP